MQQNKRDSLEGKDVVKKDIKRKVVFCPIHMTSLNAMIAFAVSMQKSTGCIPIFLLATYNMHKLSNLIEDRNIKVIKVDPYVWHNNTLIAKLRQKVIHMVHKWVLAGYPFPNLLFRHIDEFYIRLEKYYQELLPLLSQLNPKSIVIPDDRSLGYGFLPALLKVCLTLGVTSVVPPISYAGDRRDLVYSRKSLTIFSEDKLFKKYPNNLVESEIGCSISVSFYPAITTEVLYRFGSLSKNPWVLGGGLSDLVLVDGKEMESRYIYYGCDPKKIIVTGQPFCDSIFYALKNKNELRNKLSRKYGLDKGHLTVLSLPQYGEHKILPWDKHWEEIRFLCEILSSKTGDVLVSLHPKMEIEQYEFIESEFGISIVDENLKDILPIADSFTATFSSTVDWAVLCKIPTIVFDFIGIDTGICDDYDGVVVVNSRGEYSSLISQVQNDMGFCQQLIKGHIGKAESLSPLDGNCMERVINIFCQPEIVMKRK